MKRSLPSLGNRALCASLLTGLLAIGQLSTISAATKAVTLGQTKSASAAEGVSIATTVEAARLADKAKAAEDPKLSIKSIELAEAENAPGKDLPWLGVSSNEAGEALASQLGLEAGVGLVVSYVAPDSPAAKAGLQKNDVLVEFQDHALVLPAQLRKLVQARKEGDTVKLKFYRAGQPQTVSATLANSPSGIRMADGEEGLSRGLHLRLLGHPSGKELAVQMDSLKGLLGNLKIDQKKIQEEVSRSVEKARKSYQEALRQFEKSTSATDASRQALEELAKSGVLLDNQATVTVRSNDKSTKSLVKTDDAGTVVLVANPKLHLTAHDRDGKLLFDGAVETEEQRAKVPKEVWEKVEPLLSKFNAKPEE